MGAIYLAHSAGGDHSQDFIRSQLVAWRCAHNFLSIVNRRETHFLALAWIDPDVVAYSHSRRIVYPENGHLPKRRSALAPVPLTSTGRKTREPSVRAPGQPGKKQRGARRTSLRGRTEAAPPYRRIAVLSAQLPVDFDEPCHRNLLRPQSRFGQRLHSLLAVGLRQVIPESLSLVLKATS
jgi:hypothetical protein